jgi:hypothetical protein
MDGMSAVGFCVDCCGFVRNVTIWLLGVVEAIGHVFKQDCQLLSRELRVRRGIPNDGAVLKKMAKMS